jgi:hypothetical protein
MGLAALDRSVALGGNRAMFPGLAALLRLSLNPKVGSMGHRNTSCNLSTGVSKPRVFRGR